MENFEYRIWWNGGWGKDSMEDGEDWAITPSGNLLNLDSDVDGKGVEAHVPVGRRVNFEILLYTGLKDKNGKKIYVGDILKMDDWTPENYQVRFIEGTCCLAFLSGEHKDHFAGDIHYIQHADKPRATVIGNIYENKDLIQ